MYIVPRKFPKWRVPSAANASSLAIMCRHVSGLVDTIGISGPSVRLLVANWSCESSYFHNNPQADLHEGLRELDLKPESLRFVVCVTSDLLQDAAFPIETWILDKAAKGFRSAINLAIFAG